MRYSLQFSHHGNALLERRVRDRPRLSLVQLLAVVVAIPWVFNPLQPACQRRFFEELRALEETERFLMMAQFYTLLCLLPFLYHVYARPEGDYGRGRCSNRTVGGSAQIRSLYRNAYQPVDIR
jgi:hypothetical protein